MREAWTREEAIALCSAIHPLTNQCGCYVALTGGLLYKTGPRKDCDLIFYRIRGIVGIDTVDEDGNYESVDPNPDPKPEDDLIAAIVEAECAQAGEDTTK